MCFGLCWFGGSFVQFSALGFLRVCSRRFGNPVYSTIRLTTLGDLRYSLLCVHGLHCAFSVGDSCDIGVVCCFGNVEGKDY